MIAIPSQPVRFLVVLPSVFVMPGYFFLETLWPGDSGPDRIWRLILVVPVSIALVGGLLLLVHYSASYDYKYFVALLTLLNAALAVASSLRHKASADSYHHTRDLSSRLDRSLQKYRPGGWHVLLIVAFLVLLGCIAYAIVMPRQLPPLTEFYVLTEDGHLPVSVDSIIGSDFTLKYGIRNHEGKVMEYRLVVLADTAEGSIELWSETVTMPDGSTVEGLVDLSSKPSGTKAFQLLLFLPGEPEPYRSLRLFLEER
jgi:uncharacterized membrane protein